MGKWSRTPYVLKGYLHWVDDLGDDQSEQKIPVGTSAWLLWLEGKHNTTFYYDNVVCDFTARRERRRRGWVWYAYKKANGRLHKAYLGPGHLITQNRLNEAANRLYDSI